MEHLALEVKFTSGDAGLVSGYASLFGRPADAVQDVIAAGAFRSTLATHDSAGTMPEMLREHKGAPVGNWLDIEEDELGLRVKGRIDLSTPEGRDAYEAVRTGKIDGLSIGYYALKSDRGSDGVRTLQQIDLREISLVRRPASSRARVLSVKAEPTAAKGAATFTRTANMDKKATAPGGEPGNGAPSVEDRVAGLEQNVTSIDTRLKAVEDAVGGVKSAADRIEAKLNRPGATIEAKAAPEKIEAKAFAGYLRQGREVLPAEEVKSLRVSDDTAGGYLAPADFVAQVIKNLVEFSPVRQAARVGSTASGSVILPKRTGRPNAYWVGEDEERTETGSTYGQLEIPVHESACYVDVSLRLLEDAAVNIESEVSADLAEEFGRIEGVAFVSGDGVKKPMGFMSDAGVGFGLNGHATALSADALISLAYSMPAFYRNKGAWMMNGATLAAVRKLKDGQNNYLWQPSYQAGQPETLLGRPVIEAIDMPDVASGAFPIAFGDFGSAYRIYDRVALSVMRDPFSKATSGLVRFHARRRVGGGVVLAEAVKKLKMATS